VLPHWRWRLALLVRTHRSLDRLDHIGRRQKRIQFCIVQNQHGLLEGRRSELQRTPRRAQCVSKLRSGIRQIRPVKARASRRAILASYAAACGSGDSIAVACQSSTLTTASGTNDSAKRGPLRAPRKSCRGGYNLCAVLPHSAAARDDARYACTRNCLMHPGFLRRHGADVHQEPGE